MKILGYELSFTKEKKFIEENTNDNLPTEEVAWSEDSIFQRTAATKYNPDVLIGKKGHSIYRKMMVDEQIKAVVKFKRDAITSREYIFEVDRKELGDEEADRRIEIAERYFKEMTGSPIDVFNGIMSAMWQGVSFTEKIFKQIQVDGKTYWGIDKLKLKPFDTFEFVVDDFGNVEKLVQNSNGKKQDIDMSKLIHHVQNPEYDAQYGQSDLREAYRAWFSKDMAITFYNMWLERSASGFKWVNTTAKKDTAAYTAIQNLLRNSANGAGMILGKDDVFNVEFPSGEGKSFCAAIDKHDLGIARALLVPNLLGITPTGQTGSYSQSDTQLEAFLWTLDQEALRLEESLNEQLFRELGEINFGDELWPRFKFQPISDKRKVQLIGLWKDLITAGAVKHSESDEAHVRELLEFPEKDMETADDTDDTEADTEEDDTDTTTTEEDKKGDETVGGKLRVITNKAWTKNAEQRVDFKVMQAVSESMESDKGEEIAHQMFLMTENVVSQVRELYATDDLEKKQNTIKFTSESKNALRRNISSALQDFWKLGQKHAENEIDKAKKLAFSMKVDRERLDFISKDFFKVKSFKVAGKLADDAIAIISQAIANGVKGGKTFKEIEQDIYRNIGGAGYLTEEDYRKALGEAIDPNLTNPQARIDTMLRTNGFEAINEARFSYFTDPDLDGFVQALEYSSILDSRTTQICQHLDGKVYPTNSEEWKSYRPPNHFNCRSILIPVTAVDKWTKSEEPTIDPQKGFA